MVVARIYLEGGGQSKDLQARCRKAFRKLFERAGFAGRMPRLRACGGRDNAFENFRTAHANYSDEYIALLADSEEPVSDVEQPWAHLRTRDRWERPSGATNDQALLMVTCMETWIACDHAAIDRRFGPRVRLGVLPPVAGLEQRDRKAVFEALRSATADCPAVFSKGAISFEVLATVSPDSLMALSGFARVRRILEARL